MALRAASAEQDLPFWQVLLDPKSNKGSSKVNFLSSAVVFKIGERQYWCF